MAGGKDEYYRPWLDGIDDDQDMGAAPGKPAASPADDSPAPAPDAERKPTPSSRKRAPSAPAEQRAPVVAPLVANTLAGLKRGWAGFAATTIRLGERADVPARVAALELGDKARTLAGAVSRETRKAGKAIAQASIATGKASGAAIGKAGSQAGGAIGSAAARTRAATRKGFDSSVTATRTQGGKIASGAKDAARPVIARVAPPKPAAPVVGSAFDRLVADENANSPTAAQNRAGDLPLFGDFSEAGANTSDGEGEAEPIAPEAVEVPSPASESRGHKPKRAASAAAPPPSIDETPETTTADASEVASDDAKPPTRRIVIGLAIIAVLVVAILAGSAFWGRDASTGTIVATVPDSGSPLAAIDAGRRAEIETVVEAYILDHPEIIPQALERLQQRESAAAIAKLRPAIEEPFAGAWGGNPKGDVVITEYSDFACTFCRRSLPDIERLLKTDPGVKIVYRELPILTAQSGPAAKVGLAAARKGRYRDYHLALFALGQPSDANILTAAAKAGMTPEDVAAARFDPALDREIASNVSVAQQLRFEGTPSFVVGDQILHGAVGFDALKAAVAKARE